MQGLFALGHHTKSQRMPSKRLNGQKVQLSPAISDSFEHEKLEQQVVSVWLPSRQKYFHTKQTVAHASLSELALDVSPDFTSLFHYRPRRRHLHALAAPNVVNRHLPKAPKKHIMKIKKTFARSSIYLHSGVSLSGRLLVTGRLGRPFRPLLAPGVTAQHVSSS